VKPIAIVFPQYHQFAENDRLWGEGFTEWTMLKPMPRFVNNVTTRFPHKDIGYYNFLEFDHRRYMRIMADHFGVYGFAFYHYWFKDHPVMNAPVDKMLEDGEPNKPFFFCWANEAWTKRWDGSRNEILIDQDYTDVQGNINHFEYLLKFFRHKNYILVDGRPMFSFYRIEQTDVSRLDAIMALWDKLAVENGLQGIHFVRWLGPFDNRIKSAHIAGGIEFEPGYSSAWRSVIATSKGVSVKSLFAKSSPTEQLFRSSQYKVYDRNIVWRNIENKVLPKNVICGTFATWNNAPRRNFTNDNYNSYPHMYMPDTLRGLQKHLEFMRAKVLYRRTRERYLLLTAWNEWNEQAQFEPSDVDGYDALSAVK
ncbi:unnamed protein product, partial [Ectocarpus fasciculatus]